MDPNSRVDPERHAESALEMVVDKYLDNPYGGLRDVLMAASDGEIRDWLCEVLARHEQGDTPREVVAEKLRIYLMDTPQHLDAIDKLEQEYSEEL